MKQSSPQKFRPYLSIPELREIVGALKQVSGNLILISYLESQIYKASSGLNQAQYTPTPRPTIQTKLGFGESPAASLTVSLGELKTAAYNKWLSSPVSCTIQELARARMYRYENDLMSPEEESDYESALDRGY